MEEFTALEQWQAEISNLANNHSENREHFRHFVQTLLRQLIESRPQMLPQVLYRLDVDEAKVQKVMQLDFDSMLPALADLIVDREVLRQALKARYKGKV